MKPEPRPLKLDAHVIAYLGDYMNNLKQSITRIAKETVQELNIQKRQAPKQTVRSCTASARNPS